MTDAKNSNKPKNWKAKKRNYNRGKTSESLQSEIEKLQGEIDAHKELEAERTSVKKQEEVENQRRLLEAEDELINNDANVSFKHARPQDKRDRKKYNKILRNLNNDDRHWYANVYFSIFVAALLIGFIALKFLIHAHLFWTSGNYISYPDYWSFSYNDTDADNITTEKVKIVHMDVPCPQCFMFWCIIWSLHFVIFFTFPLMYIYLNWWLPSIKPDVRYRTRYTIKGRNKPYHQHDVRTDEQKRSQVVHSNPLVRTVVIERYIRVTLKIAFPKWLSKNLKLKKLIKGLPGLESSTHRHVVHSSKRRISYELFVQLRKHSSMHVGLKMKTRMLKLNTHASYILGVNINRFNTDDLISNTVLVAAAYAKSARFSIKNEGNFLFALSDDA
jgi:hypothetical protein